MPTYGTPPARAIGVRLARPHGPWDVPHALRPAPLLSHQLRPLHRRSRRITGARALYAAAQSDLAQRPSTRAHVESQEVEREHEHECVSAGADGVEGE